MPKRSREELRDFWRDLRRDNKGLWDVANDPNLKDLVAALVDEGVNEDAAEVAVATAYVRSQQALVETGKQAAIMGLGKLFPGVFGGPSRRRRG